MSFGRGDRITKYTQIQRRQVVYHNSPKHIQNATTALSKARQTYANCIYCNLSSLKSSIKKHEQTCFLNPINKKPCPVCDNPIKNYKQNQTCSTSCANKLTKSGPNNGNWSNDRYQTTCFHFHKKECVVCGEQNIVTVHHLDENHNNNDPGNLIPLCPTHHQYWHSKHKYLVEKTVLDYISKWKKCNVGTAGFEPATFPVPKTGAMDQTTRRSDITLLK